MTDEPRKPKQFFDLRSGGAKDWLIVEGPEGDRLAWLVDYDRWRDEGWTVERAWPLYERGAWSQGCIILAMAKFQVLELFRGTCFGPYETWTNRLFTEALSMSCFLPWQRWPKVGRLPDEEVRALLERYFDGFDVDIAQVDHNPTGWVGFRKGFDVVFRSLPKSKLVFCGEDPESVKPCPQRVNVQINDEHLHAEAMFCGPAVRGLAIGLNVFIMEELDRRQKKALVKDKVPSYGD